MTSVQLQNKKIMKPYLTRYANLIEWACRILFTINILLPGINYDDGHYYPLDVLVLVIVSLWLYFFRLKLLALVPLLFALLVSYMHLGVGPHT
jgi:hypothetical protein